MNKAIRAIPNVLTLGNLFCGVCAILASLQWHAPLWVSLFFISLSAILDLFDGLVARLLHAQSSIGADLDSLADIVSFGLAPMLILIEQVGDSYKGLVHEGHFYTLQTILLLPVLAGALRLARFNNDPSQGLFFRGIPIPANALFWLGFSAIYKELLLSSPILYRSILISILSISFSYLMLCPCRFLSIKFKLLRSEEPHRTIRNSWTILLVLLLLLMIRLGWSGFAIFIPCYIVVSRLAIFILNKKNILDK